MNGPGLLKFKWGVLLSVLACLTVNNPCAGAQGKSSQDVASTSSVKNMIGNIKDRNAQDGCGCYFSFPSEERKRFPRFVFASDLDEQSAWMNIDGQDVKLKLVQFSGPQESAKIGSKLARTYAAAGLKVHILYVTTKICQPDDESCESTEYRASFTVRKGARQQTMRLKGSCGC
jgi:hypothetical protein